MKQQFYTNSSNAFSEEFFVEGLRIDVNVLLVIDILTILIDTVVSTNTRRRLPALTGATSRNGRDRAKGAFYAPSIRVPPKASYTET
jgi:hypothetical protein